MLKYFSRIAHLVEKFHDWIHLVAGICILIVGVSYIIAIIARALEERVRGTYELNEIMMIFIVFFALAYTQKEKRHIKADLFTQRLGRLSKPLLDGIVASLCLIFLLYLTYLSFEYAYEKFLIDDYRYGDIRYPVWPLRYIIAIGFSLFALQIFIDISHYFAEVKKVLSANKIFNNEKGER